MSVGIRAPVASRLGFAWRDLVRTTGVAAAAMAAAAAVGLGDLEAGAVAVGAVLALLLLRLRTGLMGLLALGVSFTNIAVWMLPAAASNLAHEQAWIATAIPSTLGVTALAGVVAVVGALWQRRSGRPEGHLPATVGIGAVVLVLVATLAAVVAGLGQVQPRQGDLEVGMGQVRFEPSSIRADAGTIGVVVTNSDLFWHTFTIRDLDVTVSVPVQGVRRIEFEASPGSYEVVCAIPGHEQAGMVGRLTVS